MCPATKSSRDAGEATGSERSPCGLARCLQPPAEADDDVGLYLCFEEGGSVEGGANTWPSWPLVTSQKVDFQDCVLYFSTHNCSQQKK